MKRVIFSVLVAIVVTTGAFATISAPAAKQAENVYTYYLDGECDKPVYCSPEYTGPVCSQEFQGRVVYDSEGCFAGHEVTTILGRKPLN